MANSLRVMATGIVSIVAFLLGMSLIARASVVVNIVAYLILWLLTLGRLFFTFLVCWPM